jgi:hypothetical protein
MRFLKTSFLRRVIALSYVGDSVAISDGGCSLLVLP